MVILVPSVDCLRCGRRMIGGHGDFGCRCEALEDTTGRGGFRKGFCAAVAQEPKPSMDDAANKQEPPRFL